MSGETIECPSLPFDASLLRGGEEGGVCGVPVPAGGRIEVRVPEEFVQENPERVHVKWIDFYR